MLSYWSASIVSYVVVFNKIFSLWALIDYEWILTKFGLSPSIHIFPLIYSPTHLFTHLSILVFIKSIQPSFHPFIHQLSHLAFHPNIHQLSIHSSIIYPSPLLIFPSATFNFPPFLLPLVIRLSISVYDIALASVSLTYYSLFFNFRVSFILLIPC